MLAWLKWHSRWLVCCHNRTSMCKHMQAILKKPCIGQISTLGNTCSNHALHRCTCCTCARAHTHAHKHIHSCTHTHIFTHIYTHVHTHTHIHTLAHTHTSVHTNVHTHTHTHTHVHSRAKKHPGEWQAPSAAPVSSNGRASHSNGRASHSMEGKHEQTGLARGPLTAHALVDGLLQHVYKVCVRAACVQGACGLVM